MHQVKEFEDQKTKELKVSHRYPLEHILSKKKWPFVSGDTNKLQSYQYENTSTIKCLFYKQNG